MGKILILLLFAGIQTAYSQVQQRKDFYGRKYNINSTGSNYLSHQQVTALIEKICAIHKSYAHYVVHASEAIPNCQANVDEKNRPIIVLLLR